MPQNIFKIYDGRTSFWQWDRNQKLIVLNDAITEVHFSNRNMTHSIKKDVYKDNDGVRLCNVPSELLKLPRNLVAYAYADGVTMKSVKFAVIQRPMPNDYISDQSDEIEDKFTQIDIMLDALNENKADNICVDEDGNVQLTSNGELIGNCVALPSCEASVIDNCYIDENGHLIVVLTNGKSIDCGYVGNENGATFIPHISEDKILSWTCDKDLPIPDSIDLNPFDEWVELGDDGEADSQYVWETM